jgi:hypothetical protein
VADSHVKLALQHCSFHTDPKGAPQDGELTWVKLRISRVLFVLHNPRYAGAFVYGRTRKRKTVEGHLARLPQDEWHTFLIGAHAGYIP